MASSPMIFLAFLSSCWCKLTSSRQTTFPVSPGPIKMNSNNEKSNKGLNRSIVNVAWEQAGQDQLHWLEIVQRPLYLSPQSTTNKSTSNANSITKKNQNNFIISIWNKKAKWRLIPVLKWIYIQTDDAPTLRQRKAQASNKNQSTWLQFQTAANFNWSI